MKMYRTMKMLMPVLAVACLAAVSCRTDIPDNIAVGKVTVGFALPDASTKTSVNPDGLSSSWSSEDRLSVWARNSAGDLALDGTVFNLYGEDGAMALFTATLPQAMPNDSYTYYASYPVPESVDGTKLTFTLPSVQDGKAGNGADILIASPIVAGPINEVEKLSDYTKLGMNLQHILHHFRLFVPAGEDKLGGEPIEKMILTFPKDVCGTLTADYTDPDAALTLSDGSATLTLELSEPLEVSDGSGTHYAVAALMPTDFSESDSFVIKTYSASKIGVTEPVSLKGRSFLAGHSTPVRVLLSEISDYCKVRFTVSGNNLGEDADAIRLTAPDGCVWGDGSTVYEYRPGHKITTGESFDIGFEDTDAYRAFSGKTVTVTFDTEHVDAAVQLIMPDMSSGILASVSASLPYLLYEDFSSVESFNSGDKYSMSNAGPKNPTSFLNGWTGARCGAEAGHCIRTACRRETSADYDARVDSAPIIALKKAADIRVTFDYGADNEYGSLTGKPDAANVGQNIYIGYVTSTEGYASDKTTGVFEDGNSFYIKEYTGSYTSTPHTDTYTISSAPTGVVRIAWRAEIEHQAGLHNTTAWLYIDNVKVQIANK